MEFIVSTHRKGSAKDSESPYVSTVAYAYRRYLETMEGVYDEPTWTLEEYKAAARNGFWANEDYYVYLRTVLNCKNDFREKE